MLSDSDRRRLAEIEWSLRLDDPRWVYRFERRRRRRAWRLTVVLNAVACGLAMMAVGFTFQRIGLAVCGLAVVTVASGVWLAFGRRGNGRYDRYTRPPGG